MYNIFLFFQLTKSFYICFKTAKTYVLYIFQFSQIFELKKIYFMILKF